MLRRFECTTNGHNKFWTIEWNTDGNGNRVGTNAHITWGRIGGAVQRTSKSMTSGAIHSLMDEKIAKGYKEVGTNTVHSKPLTIKPDTKKMTKLLGNNNSLI